ncbi:MAG: MMPL family transporter [Sedimentisphaerales bacterium]|nr:MMPL family transporter [Sedimentisphaerales bacterium]
MDRLADFIDRHRRMLTCLLVGLVLIALVGITRMDLAVDLNFLLNRKSEAFRILDRLNAEFGSESSVCLMLIQGQDVFGPECIILRRNLAGGIRRIDGVENVFGIDDVPVFTHTLPEPLIPQDLSDPDRLTQARQAALVHPLVAGQMLSADGRTTVVIIRLAQRITTANQYTPIVDAIRDLARSAAAGGDLKIQLTGSPAFQVDIRRFMHRENLKLFLIPPAIGFLIAMLLLRRFAAVFLAGCPPTFGVLLTMGASGWIGAKWTMLSMAIPTMVFVVGLTDAIHMVLHMRRQVSQEGHTPRQAALSAVREIGWACALTSLTTAVGFGSLVLADSPAVRNLGLFCAAGTVITFFVVIVFIPIVGATFVGARATHTSRTPLVDQGISGLEHIIDGIIRHPRPVVLGGIAVLGLLACSILRLRIDTSYDWFPMDEESVQAYFTYDEAFEGGNVINVLIEWPAGGGQPPEEVFAALRGIHRLFDEDPRIHYPLSALNLVQCAPEPLREPNQAGRLIAILPADLTRRFIRLDHRCAVVSARYVITGSAATILKLHERYQEKLHALAQHYPRLSIQLTGENYIGARMVYRIIYELGLSLSLAAVIITAVMLAAFRSWRYGPICLVPNILPLTVICAGLLVIRKPLNVANVLLFTICLGIAVDDTIHFITRYRHERQAGHDPAEAVRRSFRCVGRAIITTTFIFVFSFAGLVTSSLEGYHNFALLSCMGFVAALLGDLFLLPALLLAWDKRTGT